MIELNLYNAFKAMSFDVDLDPFTRRYCLKRLNAEGYKFLTVTLPVLSKAVLASLEKGYFDRPLGFLWKGKSLAVFPRFLNKIFDPKTGIVRPDVDALAVYSLRQFCEYCYKLALPFDDTAIVQHTEKFLETDLSVPVLDYDNAYVDQLRTDFETYYPDLAHATVDGILAECRPRSGPGTFSGSEPDWYFRKYEDYNVPSYYSAVSWASKPTAGSPMPCTSSDPSYSELLFVPKDSRGPRVIIREPYSSLRYQLAFNSFLSQGLERASHKRINFQDQQVNRDLAEHSSVTGDNATLDLKDASDRVSHTIIKHIFRYSPGLLFFLLRRTSTVRLPDGKFHVLRKLSGMGSGYTFPCMSLLIHLTVTRTIVTYTGLPYRTVARSVYVYGDDLIVKTGFTGYAKTALERVGLLLNPEKCYHRGSFRESCGGDFFGGQDVAPVRLRLSGGNPEVASRTAKTARIRLTAFSNAVLQLERHARECVNAGLLDLATYYYLVLESHLGKLPQVAGDSPIIGRYTQLPLDYPQDATGAYKKVRVINPVPVVKSVEERCNPWVFLGTKVTPRDNNPLDYLCCTVGSAYGEVQVPRKVRLARCAVSGFRLMG